MPSSAVSSLGKQAAYASNVLARKKDEEGGISDAERHLLAAPIGFSAGMLGSYGLNTASMGLARSKGRTFSPEQLESFLESADVQHPYLRMHDPASGNFVAPFKRQTPETRDFLERMVEWKIKKLSGQGPVAQGILADDVDSLKEWLETKKKKSLYQLDKRSPQSSVAAHEAGHLLQRDVGGINDLTGSLYHKVDPLKWGLPAAALTAALPNRTAARVAALGSTAAMSPMVIHELLGSHHGGKALAKHMGGSWWDKTKNYLSTYKGVPTYASLALAPLLAYWAASSLGRWKDKDEDKPKEERNRL
jgi:hypothetical protein